MSKRKRSTEDLEESTSHVPDIRKQRRILYAFSQGAHQLAQAFKLAKGFERQKLGRRRKDAEAQKDYRGMRRIDEEVAALKAIDANVAAKQYIAKNLIKIKAVITNPDLPPDIGKPAAPSTDPAVLNVTARLCSSTPVRNALPTAMKEVKSELGIGTDDLRPGKKKRLRAKDYQNGDAENSAEGQEDEVDADAAAKLRNALGLGAQRPDSGSGDSDDDGVISDDEEDGSGRYRSRLAFSDEDEDDDQDEDEDEELGSDIEAIERRLEAEGIGRKKPREERRYDAESDLELSDDESEADIPVPRKVAAPNKSAFMPSLTLGGYISGSGSDIDDAAALAPRKNRRGQRARQQIWEKKFGVTAKHLQKPAGNARWDPKRGATDRNVRGGRQPMGRGGPVRRPNERGPGDRTAHAKGSSETKKPKRDDTGPLHPSWEAAKRAKEKKSVPVAFQGKKISFD